MGDLPVGLSASDRTRAENITRAISAELAKLNLHILFGGRKNTLAELLLKSLQRKTSKEFIQEHVSTYLPSDVRQSEIPASDFVAYGAEITTEGLPEQRREALVQDADVVVVMGTGRGITEMVRICHEFGRFVIPLPCANGPAVAEYSEIARNGLRHRPSNSALRILGNRRAAPKEVATALATLLRSFRDRHIGRSAVFLAMPFVTEFRQRKSAERALIRACRELGLPVDIARDTLADKPLITEILSRIERSAAVVAYLDLARPNVYFEAGYALGLGRSVVLCIRCGEDPAFDVQAFEQIRWRDIEDLERKLLIRLRALVKHRKIIA